MKKTILHILIILGMLSTTACTSDADTTQSDVEVPKNADGFDSRVPGKELQKHILDYGNDFQVLAVTFDGVFRGVHMGDSKEKVKSLENGKLEGESPTSLIYNLKINNDEEAEIVYIFENNMLTKMSLSVDMKTQIEYESLLAEFTDFFTLKFGAPQITSAGNEIWKPTKQHEIDIVDLSDPNHYRFEIDIK